MSSCVVSFVAEVLRALARVSEGAMMRGYGEPSAVVTGAMANLKGVITQRIADRPPRATWRCKQ